MNLWNRAIFDALEKHNGNEVLFVTLMYIPLMVASVALQLTLVFTRMTMQRKWRAWLNDHLVDRWLNRGRYYQLNLVDGDHKNPEFCIADDVRVATESPVDFITGVVSASLSAMMFIVVLWTIGGTLEFNVDTHRVVIPGFLVVAAVIYSVLARGAMVLIGRGFVPVSEGKNQSEAEYRYLLTRLRENGEITALLCGEDEERSCLS